VRIAFSVILVSAWPNCSAMTAIGMPRVASVEPCVWRSTWNETAGLIFPRASNSFCVPSEFENLHAR
jgi:hypothetical protein